MKQYSLFHKDCLGQFNNNVHYKTKVQQPPWTVYYT